MYDKVYVDGFSLPVFLSVSLLQSPALPLSFFPVSFSLCLLVYVLIVIFCRC